MPISFSMIVLSSQLVIAVADQVPKFDVAKSCKLDVAATTGLTDNQPVKSCMNDEQKAQQQLVSALKTGDRVVTNGGIHGLISNVKETTVLVKVADNVKIEVEKSAVTTVINSAEGSAS